MISESRDRRANVHSRTAAPRRRVTYLTGVAALTAGALALAGCGSSSGGSSSGGGSTSVHLKVASIMSFTGDLSTFGPPLDAATKLAVSDITAALRADGLSGANSISLVDSQDDQSATSPAVEAATKEVTIDGASVIIGTLSSTSTIAVAQSVTIPNQVMLVSPVASSPSITSLKDDNLVFQMYPNDNFQATELISYIGKTLGSSAKLNVGFRNDDYGNSISKIFIDGWKKQGGSIGRSVSWDPNATTFDDAAQKLASGSPDAWVIFDFPVTFEQVGPALVRTGTWDPAKTFVSAEFADAKALSKIGAAATTSLRGVGPATDKTPLQARFATHFTKAYPSISPTGYEGYAYDAVVSSFLAALQANSTKPTDIAKHMQMVTNGPGTHYTYENLAAAIKAIVAGKPVKYDGVSGPLDLSAQGAPTASRYSVWKYADNAISTLETSNIGS